MDNPLPSSAARITAGLTRKLDVSSVAHHRGGARQIAETEADPLLVYLRRISEQLARIEHKLDEVIRRGAALGLRHELTEMTRELDDIEQKLPPAGC